MTTERTDLVLIDKPRPHTTVITLNPARAHAIEMETHTRLYVRLTTKIFEDAVRARKEGRPPTFED